MNSEKDVKKCSKCGCKKLLKFFKIRKNTGAYYKTCMKCCEKSKKTKKRCPCGTYPTFAFIGEKNATCCSKCRKDGMVDIKNKKCACGKIPIFGFIGDKSASCCSNCKKDGMIDIKNKKCACGKFPHFGFIGDKSATCCLVCKEDGMINIKDKKCPCGTIPNFGFIGDKSPTCCSKCKKDGMIDIKSKHCPCGTHPSFAFIGDKTATCCSKCKEDEMVDIKSNRCKTPLCDIQAHNKRRRGYCSRCFFFTFPDEKTSRNYKTKENLVAKYIKDSYPEYDWKFDTIVKGGCSKKRPDIFCDFGSHCLVIEVDETKHSGYSCENLRVMTLFQDFGNRPLVVIRFNPDSYTDSDNKKHTSCFVVKVSTGNLEVKSEMAWKKRLRSLKDFVDKYSVEYQPVKDLVVKELFFF